MKTKWIATVLLMAGGWLNAMQAAAPAVQAAKEQEIKDAVLATNTAMIAAADRLDLDAFFAFMVDGQANPVVQNGVIFRTRQEAHEAVAQGLRGVTKVERRIDHPAVTVLGPDAALLVGDGSVTATADDGRVMVSRFAVSLVFVRRAGAWKLLHGHYSMPQARG